MPNTISITDADGNIKYLRANGSGNDPADPAVLIKELQDSGLATQESQDTINGYLADLAATGFATEATSKAILDRLSLITNTTSGVVSQNLVVPFTPGTYAFGPSIDLLNFSNATVQASVIQKSEEPTTLLVKPQFSINNIDFYDSIRSIDAVNSPNELSTFIYPVGGLDNVGPCPLGSIVVTREARYLRFGVSTAIARIANVGSVRLLVQLYNNA